MIFLFFGIMLILVMAWVSIADNNEDISLFIKDNEAPPYANVDMKFEYKELKNSNECELISLVSILHYYKYDAAVDELTKAYIAAKREGTLIKHKGLLHSKSSYHPRILTKVANDFIKNHNGVHEARNITGTSFIGLLKNIQEKVPVIVWADRDIFHFLKTNVHDTSYWGEYCGVLFGYDKKERVVLVFNPYVGFQEIDMEVFYDAFMCDGQRAVVIK